VRQAQIPDKVDRPCSVREVSRHLDVSTLLTPAAGHLGRLDLGRFAEEVSRPLNCPVVCLLGTRMCSTRAHMVIKGVELELRGLLQASTRLFSCENTGAF